MSGDPLKDGFTGGCFCGEIALAVTGAPHFAYLCHCSDCRRINGSAFHTGIAVRAADFCVTAGTPATFVSTADSGHVITRRHCPRCATQLYSTTTADNALVSVKAGAAHVPAEAIMPALQIFYDSRVPWVPAPRDLTTYARGMRGESPITISEAPSDFG